MWCINCDSTTKICSVLIDKLASHSSHKAKISVKERKFDINVLFAENPIKSESFFSFILFDHFLCSFFTSQKYDKTLQYRHWVVFVRKYFVFVYNRRQICFQRAKFIKLHINWTKIHQFYEIRLTWKFSLQI